MRLNAQFKTEYEEWRQQSLVDQRFVYIWVDGVHIKAGVARENAAVLTVIGADIDGRKHLIALEEGYRESKESWLEVLRNLRDRGMQAPVLAVGDGALGFWAAVAEVWPHTQCQRCWFHKMGNVLDKLPQKERKEAAPHLPRFIWPAPMPPPSAWHMTWPANGKRAIPKRPLACLLISMLACATLIIRGSTGSICAPLIRWKALSRPYVCALMPRRDSALLAVACIWFSNCSSAIRKLGPESRLRRNCAPYWSRQSKKKTTRQDVKERNGHYPPLETNERK